MLDLGAHRGFSTIGLLIGIAERPVLVGALVGEVLGLGRKLLESLALLLAPVGAIAIQPRLLAMQQVGQLVAVVHVTRGHAGAVYQAAVTVHPDVQLHAKVVSRPRQLPPQSLAEPYVTLSRHTAPVIQPRAC